jgi:alcohol dehydrogenase class IV
MFVVDPFLKRDGEADTTVSILNKAGIRAAVFDDVRPNPTGDIVAACVEKCRDEKVDVIIGMGAAVSWMSQKYPRKKPVKPR